MTSKSTARVQCDRLSGEGPKREPDLLPSSVAGLVLRSRSPELPVSDELLNPRPRYLLFTLARKRSRRGSCASPGTHRPFETLFSTSETIGSSEKISVQILFHLLFLHVPGKRKSPDQELLACPASILSPNESSFSSFSIRRSQDLGHFENRVGLDLVMYSRIAGSRSG